MLRLFRLFSLVLIVGGCFGGATGCAAIEGKLRDEIVANAKSAALTAAQDAAEHFATKASQWTAANMPKPGDDMTGKGMLALLGTYMLVELRKWLRDHGVLPCSPRVVIDPSQGTTIGRMVSGTPMGPATSPEPPRGPLTGPPPTMSGGLYP